MKFYWLNVRGVGEDLERARKHLGLSLREVAQGSGMNFSHLWNLEKRAKEINAAKLFALCASLGISAEDVIADNVVVDQRAFKELCSMLINAQFPKCDDASLVESAAEYQAAWASVLCWTLLSPGESKIPSGSYVFPTPFMEQEYYRISSELRFGSSLKRRRDCLVRLCKNPTQVLDELGFLSDDLNASYQNFLRKELADCMKSGRKYKPWTPQPLKVVQYFMDSDDPAVKPVATPKALHNLLASFAGTGLEVRLDLAGSKRGETTTEPAKSGKKVSSGTKKDLTDVLTSYNTSSVNLNMDVLRERLKQATIPRGKRSALARALNLPLSSISPWLTGEREPGGERTLQLLNWVMAEEAQQNKSPGSATNTTGAKTRSTHQPNEKEKRVRKNQ